MGNPDIYYKKALKYFVYSLIFVENAKLAEELFEEPSKEKLESIILQKKAQMNEKHFFYVAGRVTQLIIDEADNEGCDALNASIGGLNQFEYFIGLESETTTIKMR